MPADGGSEEFLDWLDLHELACGVTLSQLADFGEDDQLSVEDRHTRSGISVLENEGVLATTESDLVELSDDWSFWSEYIFNLGGSSGSPMATANLSSLASIEDGGDVVQASTLSDPIVADFSDAKRQFIADYATPLPGDIEKLKGFPKNTFQAAEKIDLIIRVLDAPDPLIDTYARDTRLDLANAESIVATRFDDVIFGTDAVYDWITPPPPANAPPNTPPPAPQWKVDPDFGALLRRRARHNSALWLHE